MIEKMLERRPAAVLFLALLALGVLLPVAVAARSCGDCCPGKARDCGKPAPGSFSLCCLNAQSPLPVLDRGEVSLALAARVEPFDEQGVEPPEPRGVLHVPRPDLA
jgi:hypothetical protein